ncbi:hypothetical protein DICSQDRAFT_136805 [Dichomitus squalens LYAD-421 SS1]|uniref:Uncharacterized protein n=2 Tax=Dichomitus squalens TaxID=114155 RepID=A0A4Q9MXJ5_9APHY|nr:uncharacterized protein DICSQDRAFT_136805 [Dichomitus squalens LYAD-421 SS1]EJF61252.1 hypothetical protein DICSQDRAFT_136805 [Dichomitus squalens LYAD-421 SS1]TBU32749.1 hypothetical protein BD311DRAFT_749661 [Dichomitus squalens]
MAAKIYSPGQDLQSIASLFPHVDQDVIASIVGHEFSGAELYKLDSRRILESTWHLIEVNMDESTISLHSAPAATETYPTLDSLLVPLNAYFSVLSVHELSGGQSPMLPYYFFRYSSHLVKIAAQYEWSAVLSYHLASFSRRCKEMRKGDFAGWGRVDMDLMEEFLVPNQKKRYGTVHAFSSGYQSWELIYP